MEEISVRYARPADAEATIAETTAFRDSALSIPFWEDRMGYGEQPMSLEKRLDRPAPTPTSRA